MTIAVLFRCGHRGFVDATAAVPTCPTCGAVGVSRSFAPAPRFVGHADGPLVTKRALGPVTVTLGSQTNG